MEFPVTEEELLEEIKTGLKDLKDVVGDTGEDKGFLHDLTKASQRGIKEVEGDGLTDLTCMEVSSLMLAGEADTRSQILAFGVPANLLREHVQLMNLH